MGDTSYFWIVSCRLHGFGQFLEAKVIACFPGFLISESNLKPGSSPGLLLSNVT